MVLYLAQSNGGIPDTFEGFFADYFTLEGGRKMKFEMKTLSHIDYTLTGAGTYLGGGGPQGLYPLHIFV